MKNILFFILVFLIICRPGLTGESGDEVIKKDQTKEISNSISEKSNKNNKTVENKKDEPVKIDVDKITEALKAKVGPEETKNNDLVKVDPFSKDLLTTREQRKDLGKDSLYPVSSLKLVATILSEGFNNMALIELPGLNNDQVIIQVGQKIGRDQGVVQEINETTMKVVENKKLLTLRIEN